MTIIKKTILDASKQLSSYSDSPRLDVELLLCFVIKKPRSYLHAWSDEILSETYLEQFNILLNRRINGEPVAHIVGERGFWSLNLKVTRDTLIPRPDTERIVELALELIPENAQWKILDLGTGSGAIALSLAKENPDCFLTATDQSLAALEVAEQNAVANKITNIEFIQSNWFEKMNNQQFNMIITNPPYIKENDPHLQQGDVRFEPISALTSGKDGLNDIRSIISNSYKHLTKDGVLLIEHGYDQAEKVCDLLNKANFTNIGNFKDYNDVPRVSIGHIK